MANKCSEERVEGLKKDLERAMRTEEDMNSGKTRELLLQLKCISMRLNVLEKTRIGMTINNLRKSTSDKDISQLCKVHTHIQNGVTIPGLIRCVKMCQFVSKMCQSC